MDNDFLPLAGTLFGDFDYFLRQEFYINSAELHAISCEPRGNFE